MVYGKRKRTTEILPVMKLTSPDRVKQENGKACGQGLGEERWGFERGDKEESKGDKSE